MSGFSVEQLTAMHPKTEDEAFRAGYDCAVNGADTVNCHFRFFATPDLTRAWENGKRRGEESTKNGEPT